MGTVTERSSAALRVTVTIMAGASREERRQMMERTCGVPPGAADYTWTALRPSRQQRHAGHEPAALVHAEAPQLLALAYGKRHLRRRHDPLDQRHADALQPDDGMCGDERHRRPPVRCVRPRVDARRVDRADVLVLDEPPREERLQV